MTFPHPPPKQTPKASPRPVCFRRPPAQAATNRQESSPSVCPLSVCGMGNGGRREKKEAFSLLIFRDESLLFSGCVCVKVECHLALKKRGGSGGVRPSRGGERGKRRGLERFYLAGKRGLSRSKRRIFMFLSILVFFVQYVTAKT